MSDFLSERVVWTHPDGDLMVTEYRNVPELVPPEAAEHLAAAKGGPVVVPYRTVTPAVMDKGKVVKEAVTEMLSVKAYEDVKKARALLAVDAKEIAAVGRAVR